MVQTNTGPSRPRNAIQVSSTILSPTKRTVLWLSSAPLSLIARSTVLLMSEKHLPLSRPSASWTTCSHATLPHESSGIIAIFSSALVQSPWSPLLAAMKCSKSCAGHFTSALSTTVSDMSLGIQALSPTSRRAGCVAVAKVHPYDVLLPLSRSMLSPSRRRIPISKGQKSERFALYRTNTRPRLQMTRFKLLPSCYSIRERREFQISQSILSLYFSPLLTPAGLVIEVPNQLGKYYVRSLYGPMNAMIFVTSSCLAFSVCYRKVKIR